MSMASRPRMWKIDSEMQRFCALLEEEVSTWPTVNQKPMFGMIAMYHGRKIFAAIPKTRAAQTERSVLIKLPAAIENRARQRSWTTVELSSGKDIARALRLLKQAYENAK